MFNFKKSKTETVKKAFFKVPEKIRFVATGTFNTIISYIIFVALNIALNKFFHYNIILLIQYIITVNLSYITMKVLVFRTNGNFSKEYPKTMATYIFVYLLNATILYGFQQLNIHLYISQAIALLIISVITYLLHKHINYTK